jgi:hypothetical protein
MPEKGTACGTRPQGFQVADDPEQTTQEAKIRRGMATSAGPYAKPDYLSSKAITDL